MVNILSANAKFWKIVGYNFTYFISLSFFPRFDLVAETN